MNQLRRKPNSRSSRGTGPPGALAARSGRVTGATSTPAVVAGTPSAPVFVADEPPADGSMAAAGNPAAGAAAAPPPFPNLQAAGLPAYWWTNSSPMGSNEGVYPPAGFPNFLQSNNSPENFHLVGNTTRRTRTEESAPSFEGIPPGESNVEDKETVNVDEDEDCRTERRLNWMKEEDVRLLRGEAPKVQFYINEREYGLGYYLANGIYPEWPVFVKSIREPQCDEHKLFSQHQEGERKDAERAFGILQSRFCILR